MTVNQLATILDARFLCGEDQAESEVIAACSADLMSDVMAFVKDRVVLLTGLVNAQVIRTADLMDIKVIVFVRGKLPTADLLDMARDAGLVILATRHTLFMASGLLYEAGLRRGGNRAI